MNSRRLLQATNAVFATVTIVFACGSLVFGTANPLYGAGAVADIPALDSNLRFMGGLGLGLGAGLLWVLPSIERRGSVYRLIWICALLGGLGRLWSVAAVGAPPAPMVIFTLIEVPGVPLLIYWQHRVERAWCGPAAGPARRHHRT